MEWSVSKHPTRNWLDLPFDLMFNILERVSAVDRLGNAQKVCLAWYEICKEPAMWRVVQIDSCAHYINSRWECMGRCKQALERSQGQLLDLSLVKFRSYWFLSYVADSLRRLKRLELVYYNGSNLSEVLKELPFLEELSLVRAHMSPEAIEAVGRYCPLLKSLKLNRTTMAFERAFAIGENVPQLTHLELIGSGISNTELQAILDRCSHLESLDLRLCDNLDLKGELGKRCSQQIKHLKLPHHSLEGCPHADHILYQFEDEYEDEYDDSFYDCEIYLRDEEKWMIEQASSLSLY